MFSLETALKMSDKGNLEKWVHNFLLQPDPHGNIGLLKGLKLQKRYWTGPLKIKISDIIQGCGPDSSFQFYENKENWNVTIRKFVNRMKNGEMPPP